MGRASAAAVVAVAVAAIVPLRLSARPQPAGTPARTPLEILTTPVKSSGQPEQREPRQREMNYVLFLDGELCQPACQRAVLAAADAEDETFRERAAQVVLEEVHPCPDLVLGRDHRLDAELSEDPLP